MFRLAVTALLVVALAAPAAGVTGAPDAAPAGASAATSQARTSGPSTTGATGTPRTATPTAIPGSESGNAAAGDRSTPSGPRIVAVYPNPVRDGDAGEFVVVQTGGRDTVLDDGEATVDLADPPAGRVAVSAEPSVAANLTGLPAVAAPGLALANGGETVELRRGGAVVDRIAYDTAPEGEKLVVEGGETVWRPLGFDPRPVRTFRAADATAFVLPDAPGVVRSTLRSAGERILLAGYTLTSRRVVDALLAAADRGVHVAVLLDAEPIGGRSARGAAALDRLAAAGVQVTVLGGPRARFAFHHAKYAVVDDRALVLTENWKPAGVGGRDSRGWGVRIAAPAVADDLASVFRADVEGPDAISWRSFRRGRRFESEPQANGTYPTRTDPEGLRVDRVSVLTAPGNAEGAVVGLIDDADRRVALVGPTVGDGPFLRAALRAARRGVRVRVLLSGAWYAVEENRALADRLNDLADRRNIPITARIARPGNRFGKIHAKGLLVDDAVVVGSLNWNAHAARENRELAVLLEGAAVAGYYERVFDADWEGGRRVPAGYLVGAALAVVVAAIFLGRRLR